MPNPWDDKWEMGPRLGKGAQGFAHKVTSKSDPAVIGALKYLRNNQNQQSRGRMRQEVVGLQTIESLRGLVPRVLDDNSSEFESDTQLYVVMEFIPGPTLSQYVEEHESCDIDTAVSVALRAAKILEQVHSFEVVHRDIKPDNVIVRNGDINDIVVVDFGLSFTAQVDPQAECVTRIGDNLRNEFISLPETNTPGGSRRDPRSDLAAVVGLLYYCLTKRAVGHLFKAPHLSDGGLLQARHKGDARVAGIEAVLLKGLSPTIDNRYQNAADLAFDLAATANSAKDVDEFDPIQIAQRLSPRLLAKHRPIQLEEFAKGIPRLAQRIDETWNRLQGKLGLFELHRMGGPKVALRVPDGMERVGELPYYFVLKLGSKAVFLLHLFVVSQGEECVVMMASYRPDGRPGAPPVPHDVKYEQMLRYRGGPEAIFDELTNEFNKWLGKAMHAVAAAIN